MFYMVSIYYVVRGLRRLGLLGLLKTIIFNFTYFPISTAIKLPVFLANNVKVRNCKRGSIIFVNGGGKPGLLCLGLFDREYTYGKPLFLNLLGTMVIHGAGFHHFAPGCIIYVGPDAIMEVGNNFSVSHDAKFYIRKELKIGDNNMWSYYNVIMDNDGHPIYDENGTLVNENKSVIIGNNVWIGCRCTILKGVVIPDGSIIGTNAIVRKRLDVENAIWGADSKMLRKNINWSRTLM